MYEKRPLLPEQVIPEWKILEERPGTLIYKFDGVWGWNVEIGHFSYAFVHIAYRPTNHTPENERGFYLMKSIADQEFGPDVEWVTPPLPLMQGKYWRALVKGNFDDWTIRRQAV